MTDGSFEKISEKCIIAYRTNSLKELDARSLTEELFIAQFDIRDVKGNAVAALSGLLSDVIGRSLKSTKEWGDLLKTDAGLLTKKNFLGDYDAFANFIESKEKI